jgi:hypothetical protein
MSELSVTRSLDIAVPITILDDGRELLRIDVFGITRDHNGAPSVGKIEFSVIIFDPNAVAPQNPRTTEIGNIGHLARKYPGIRPHLFAVGHRLRSEHNS